MSCHICNCSASNRTPFYCPTCARNHLYTLRYENARVLLEKESIGKEVEAAVAGNTDTKSNLSTTTRPTAREGNPRWDVQAAQTEQARASERIRTMRECMQTLRAENEERKAQIRQVKAQLKKRRSDAESANFQLADQYFSVGFPLN